MAEPLIILGGDVRAAAASAVRAGFVPWCVALRVPRDLREIGPVRTCPADQFPMGILPMLDEAPAAAPVLLAAPLENHAEFVRAVGFGRTILGSDAAAVAGVRDPRALASLKRVTGLKFPEVRTELSLLGRLRSSLFGAWSRKRYLLKPLASHGGEGIAWWSPGGRIERTQYVQEFVRGTPYTAVFHADGWSSFLLGLAETIVGDAAFGVPAGSFRVCGYVGPVAPTEATRSALSQLGVALTQRHDVRGTFGVDLVMDMAGVLWPVEVNPRYPDAAEVLERSEGVPTIRREAAAPKPPRGWSPRVWAAARVFARRDGRAPHVWALLAKDEVADVPEPGAAVRAGEPVCTVFASGATRDAALEALKAKAARVYDALG